MQVVFVDVRSGETILTESSWDLPPPHEGDILELHSGVEQRWVVEEVDWVFADAPEGTKKEVAVRTLKVMIIREGEAVRDESGDMRHHDPICTCGHPKSMHAPARCLGNASTCQCHGFTNRGN